ncbi:MAG: hypothetical protein S4CHLAM102_01680 [Chlamydiia bacterium]|nr:hypothetical protein [Chlamydiia bacterium]
MISDVKKYLFIGSVASKEQFFKRAQKMGVCEFIATEAGGRAELTPEGMTLTNALRILQRIEERPQTPFSDHSPLKIAEQIIEAQERFSSSEEELRLVKTEIARIAPLGDFSIEAVKQLQEESGRFVQFFAVKPSKSEEMKVLDKLIFLRHYQEMDYYMSVSKRRVYADQLFEIHVHRDLQSLKAQKAEVEGTIAEMEKLLQELTQFHDLLEKARIEQVNISTLEFATSDNLTTLDGNLFYTTAWIPANRLDRLVPILKDLAIQCREVEIEAEDRVPTCMQNEGTAKIGEDLVHIYDTPATSDSDPSSWVIWSFAAFFAIIISDAGYGLLYLLLALFLRFKFPNWKGAKKRALNLFTILASSCILWGVMSGSYFSIKLDPESRINRVSLFYQLALDKAEYHMKAKDDVYSEWIGKFPDLANVNTPGDFLVGGKEMKDGAMKYVIIEEFYDNIFMEMALLLGIFHLCLSFVRNTRKAWGGIGWIAFLIGGYLYCPSILQATSLVNIVGWLTPAAATEVGSWMAIGGFGLAVVLTAIQMGLLAGFEEILKIIQVFADVLSYLRLYALGLASMIMASTFNELGAAAGIFGILIIIFGHAVNISLGTLAGVIHGLRLNFLEWYHYSFEGGGTPYTPLREIKIE